METSPEIATQPSLSAGALERNNLILVLLGILVSCYFKNVSLTLSFFAGGAITVVNLRLLRRIVGALTASKAPSKIRLTLQVLVKFFGMIGVLAFVILVIKPDSVAFLLGLSTIVIAISYEGVAGLFRSE